MVTQILAIIIHVLIFLAGFALLFDLEIGAKPEKRDAAGRILQNATPGRKVQNGSIAGAILLTVVLYNLTQMGF